MAGGAGLKAPPMRFLLVTNTPWSRDLGAARVYVELAEELASLGHYVEKFSWEDAFPSDPGAPAVSRHGRASRLLSVLSGSRNFSLRARAFVRSHAHRFDVIDAGHTELPYPKADLRFAGLLVARSVALTPAYRRFELEAARRWREPWSARRFVHSAMFYPRRSRHLRSWRKALYHADLINVSNQDDRDELAGLGFGGKVMCFPFGLSEARAQAFRDSLASASERLAARTVVFIGTWNSRKGARDWPLIVRRVLHQLPDTRFLFLGTDMEPPAVLRDFPPCDRGSIEVSTRFDSAELPRLLSQVTVGAFPGYLEGFGFAVLEKLAAGLPVVAYDAPGPREMLRHQVLPTTVPVGDTEGFARLLVELLTLDAERYGRYSLDSMAVAARFRWRAIAQQTAETYFERWQALRAPSP
jgi:glycosyltransferase involved in cell wall biosynthesis